MGRRTLLAWFLLLLLREPQRAASGVSVQVLPNVTGLLNESAYLLCSLTSSENVTVTQVTWMKREQPYGSHRTLAVFHPMKGPSIADSERVKFLASRLDRDPWNASLSLSHLRLEDEGIYECQFATFPVGSRSATVLLWVLAKPNNTAEPLKPSPVLMEQPVAKCISIGGRPLPEIDWLSDLNGTFNETHESRQGTFIVISTYYLTPSIQADGKNITCRVKHESLQEPELRSLTLSSPYPPEVTISGYDNNWYVGRTGVALTCDARSKPEPTGYKWSMATGPLPNTTKVQDNRLLIDTVDKATLNNVTFICNVTNALGSQQAQITIHVEATEKQGSSTGIIIGIIFGIISIPICILIVMVILKKCGIIASLWCCRSQRSRPNLRPSNTEYSVVNSNDLEMNGTRRQNQGTTGNHEER